MIRFDKLGKSTTGALCALFAAWAILWLSGPAWAAAAPLTNDGRAVGVFCGVILLALVIYSLFLYCKPLFEDEGGGLIWALLLLLGLLLVKVALLPVLPGLGIDVGSYQAWALRMAEVGPARMYEPGYFLDYPPGYLYALWAAGSAAHALGLTGDMLRVMIESPAIIGDLLLGGLVFAMVRRTAPAYLAYAAMALFALNPALLYDTLFWGQSDSIPALLMLLSMLMLLDQEYELGWGLAALAVLTKPQALALVPVLGLWTLIKGERPEWLRSGLAFLAFGLVTIAPFQMGHAWSWLFDLYSATAGYYHESAVNAFNLMALIFGLRRDDTTAILGVSCFTIGMALVAVLYAVIAYLLWARPDRKGLFLASFLAITGFFVLAPRMHERYLYPALVVLIPLAVESPAALGIFAGLTVTFLFNLIYVKKVLDTNSFLDARDSWAMAASAANVVLFGASLWYGWQAISDSQPVMKFSELWRRVERLATPPAAAQPVAAGAEGVQCPPWERLDTLIVVALLVVAVFLRFYRIGHPNEIVFDEVHFVGQARHYLHAEDFLDPHPPLAKLLIALSIALFGDHAWAWRLPNAAIGTALVAITYLLARRMFNSRLVAGLAGMLVLCDGMFVVDSRIAVLDIVYVTFGAWAYLLLFRFIQTPDGPRRRNTLLWMAIALGLCLSAKLYVPAVTFLLVTGFMVWVLIRERMPQPEPAPAQSVLEPQKRRNRRKRNQPVKPVAVAAPSPKPARNWDPMLERRVGGALALVGGVAALVYLLAFLPHFLLGWWGGIADLVAYYGKVVWYEQSVSTATHPYAAPWWSWPLMLRPIAYWQDFPPNGEIVATIWGGGNPAAWWGALTAIIIVGFQAYERRSLPRTFIVVGYAAYLGMWIPIGRTLFLYHYMPAVYLGYLALAAVLAECWEGRALLVEKAALLATLTPVAMLGLGMGVGVVIIVAMLLTFLALLGNEGYDGKFICGLFVGAVLILFFYYAPIWLALPIQRSGYYARMWLQGPGLRSWI
ncbi:MAG TPA: phospholipid carrier-dependent glycosyltransferase [Candidatus Binataceae bacterium]|nr:phospholipid carrier-dependent glycosyltransferase [Candidatus Binataceae bacterium]